MYDLQRNIKCSVKNQGDEDQQLIHREFYWNSSDNLYLTWRT